MFAKPIRLKGAGSPQLLPTPHGPAYYFQAGTRSANTGADAMFTSANFPNASPQELSNARKLYELLTGEGPSVEDEFVRGAVAENTSGLTKPVARRHPLPKYTAAAMREKIQGDVLVDAVVGTDGNVIRVRVAQSLDRVYGLDQEALKAAVQWTFDPGVLNGETVPVVVRLVLTFRLH